LNIVKGSFKFIEILLISLEELYKMDIESLLKCPRYNCNINFFNCEVDLLEREEKDEHREKGSLDDIGDDDDGEEDREGVDEGRSSKVEDNGGDDRGE
jgi:hypothetical protein